MTNKRRTHAALFAFLVVFIAQAAWILALPPFRGSDEFDHAYRAAAVATGQWKPTYEAAANGRGDVLVVPRSLVEVARPICESYAYTGPDNCRPIHAVDADTVAIASGAGRYHPAFYWLIGEPASHLDGSPALYVMRLAASILCAAFVSLGVWCLSFWARSQWPYFGLLLSLSPVAVYSTSVAAPNGIEICAGLALWAALLGLARSDLSHSTESRLLLAAIPSTVVLATVRQLGPLFLGLILITVLLTLGSSRLLALLHAHRRSLPLVATIGCTAVIGNLWWVKTTSALALESTASGVASPLRATLSQLPLWLLQTVAAFPLKNESAPALVYAVWLTFFLLVAICALSGSRAVIRWAFVGATAATAVVAVGLTLATISETGPIWQGRYALPFAVGVPLLATLGLDERRVGNRLARPLWILGSAGLMLAHLVSVQSVFTRELATSPLSGDVSWLTVHSWAPAGLMLGSGLLVISAGFIGGTGDNRIATGFPSPRAAPRRHDTVSFPAAGESYRLDHALSKRQRRSRRNSK